MATLSRRAFLWRLVAGVPALSVPLGQVPSNWYIPDNPAARDFRQQYNLSCEVAAFKIVLMHYGLANATEELLQDLLGVNENPNKGFRGDYRALSTHGLDNYGAHAPALQRLIQSFPKPGLFAALPVANLDQAKAALVQNWLVLAWVPVALEPSLVRPLTLSTGERVNFVPGEHVIVLHGFDPGGFFTYDPRPSPRVPAYAPSDALARSMALFDVPGLAIQPLF